MKKLILSIAMFCSLGTNAQQMEGSIKPINLNLQTQSKYSTYGRNNQGSLGVGLMGGGAMFIAAGLLTVPDYNVGPNGETITKPFFKQGARMLAIMTGGICITTGVIILIGR